MSEPEPRDRIRSDGHLRRRERPPLPPSRGNAERDRRRSGSRPALELVEPEPDPAGSDEDPSIPTRPVDPAKRAVDVVFSLVGLLLTLPAWVVLPLLIKLEDGGPVFYSQERVGKGGELFPSFKFRSMAPREDDGPRKQAEKEAHRVTRVGRFMRACALDELPQLLNILRGEMSLVGPRPLLPEEEEHKGGPGPVHLEELPGYAERHSVLPGLTGLAQVYAARDMLHEEKFRYDLEYVRRRTLAVDLRLILRSVRYSLTGRWPEVGRGEA